MRIVRTTLFTLIIVLPILFAPGLYKAWHDQQFRNFHVVSDGVLYRSGQLSMKRLEQAVNELNLRTVISLRDGDKPLDVDEETWVKARGLKFVRIPAKKWAPEANGEIPAEKVLEEFRKVMDDPANYPVLVHCYAGVHRTGTMVAVYRMDYQGWSNADAIAEMRALGYNSFEEHTDVRDYMLRYQPPVREKTVHALTVSSKKNHLP